MFHEGSFLGDTQILEGKTLNFGEKKSQFWREKISILAKILNFDLDANINSDEKIFLHGTHVQTCDKLEMVALTL